MEAMIFYTFAGVSVLFSLLVILLRNPVTSALSLVGSLFFVSGIFVLLHATFLAVIQILIYAGAILVLFLYVMMLLNIRGGGRKVSYARVSQIGGVIMIPIILLLILMNIQLPDLPIAEVSPEFGTVLDVGKNLLGPNALLFELISLVLLVAIVGAIVMAERKKEEE